MEVTGLLKATKIMGYYGLNCVPPRFSCWSPTHSTSEYDLFCSVANIISQVRMSHTTVVWTPRLMWTGALLGSALIGRGNLGINMHKGRKPCKDGNREQRVSSVALNTGSRRHGVASGELMAVRNSTSHLGRKSKGRGQVVQREYFIQSLIFFADWWHSQEFKGWALTEL